MRKRVSREKPRVCVYININCYMKILLIHFILISYLCFCFFSLKGSYSYQYQHGKQKKGRHSSLMVIVF